MALAFGREKRGRVAVSFIGEGGSSLGEWHEAINLCAARRLPAIFCVQNNQTALSTPVADQSAVRVFADKAAGYGVPGHHDRRHRSGGRSRRRLPGPPNAPRAGTGPTLIELVSHAHVRPRAPRRHAVPRQDPQPSWDYPPLTEQGYANRELYAYWAARDPIRAVRGAARGRGRHRRAAISTRFKREAEAIVEEQARAVDRRAVAGAGEAGVGVFADEPPRVRHRGARSASARRDWRRRDPDAADVEPGAAIRSRRAARSSKPSCSGVGDALRADPRVFVYGEDVGGNYGNAFLLLRPLLKEFGDRIINSPLAEGAVLGVCVGAALAGQRPIGEMQFNDFVATGFNQLVNNAAKIRYRWGGSVPMVVRMPWGGLRHAGPYHSQNTEPWFYRTPGLKIVVPSTPHDARALMAAAVADPDPVLYYEHIALYRDPRIKQVLGRMRRRRSRLGGGAAPRRDDLAIISYGAYVHTAMRVAGTLAADGIDAGVLDLRTLAPLDRAAVLALARHCSRVLIVHEDFADRGDRRKPCRDHSGRSVRIARRARPHRRRARHAGAVFAAARGVLPAVGGRDRACRAGAGSLLSGVRRQTIGQHADPVAAHDLLDLVAT